MSLSCDNLIKLITARRNVHVGIVFMVKTLSLRRKIGLSGPVTSKYV